MSVGLFVERSGPNVCVKPSEKKKKKKGLRKEKGLSRRHRRHPPLDARVRSSTSSRWVVHYAQMYCKVLLYVLGQGGLPFQVA